MSDEAPQSTSAQHASTDLIDSAARPLLANTFYAIFGNGFYHACQFGVLILLAKYATPAIQGQYFLALAIATPVVLLFGLESRSALVADASSQFSFGTYRALRRLLMIPAALLLTGFLVWQSFRDPNPSYITILAGVFAAKIVWSLAEVGWGTYQRRERLDLLATSVGLRGLTLIIPFAILLPTYYYLAPGGNLATGTALAVVVHAVGVALVMWLFDRPRVLDRRYWDLSWGWPAVGALALQTLPLGVVALAINLCDTVPRVVIEMGPDGKANLGYFGALAYITLAGNLVIIQAATAAANRLAVFYQRDVRAFLRLGALLAAAAVAIGGALIVAALLFGGWFLRLIYTPEYARFETAFHIIVFAHSLALLTNIFGVATTQMRLFWVQVPVQVLTLAATIVAAVLLIPGDNPVRGGAYTALARAVVQLVLYTGCVAAGLLWRERVLRSKGTVQEPATAQPEGQSSLATNK